jgi:hypothetical protein
LPLELLGTLERRELRGNLIVHLMLVELVITALGCVQRLSEARRRTGTRHVDAHMLMLASRYMDMSKLVVVLGGCSWARGPLLCFMFQTSLKEGKLGVQARTIDLGSPILV